MPASPLTDTLEDFRAYRPGNHREFLEWVKARAQDVDLSKFALGSESSAGKCPGLIQYR